MQSCAIVHLQNNILNGEQDDGIRGEGGGEKEGRCQANIMSLCK